MTIAILKIQQPTKIVQKFNPQSPDSEKLSGLIQGTRQNFYHQHNLPVQTTSQLETEMKNSILLKGLEWGERRQHLFKSPKPRHKREDNVTGDVMQEHNSSVIMNAFHQQDRVLVIMFRIIYGFISMVLKFNGI